MKPSSPRPDALVLYSHLPGEGVPHFDAAPVTPICCWQRFDYWRGVNRHWDEHGTLILLEHDIEASDEHLDRLLACPHPACAWAYHVHWASTGLPHDLICAGTGEWCQENALQGGEGRADWTAIGLVKLTSEARVRPLRREPWPRLELAVNDAVAGPWHMHGNEPGGAGLLPHHHF